MYFLVSAENPESNHPKSFFLNFFPQMSIFPNTNFTKSVFPKIFLLNIYAVPKYQLYENCFPKIQFFKCHFPKTNIPKGQKLENQFFKILIPKSPKMAKII